MEGARFGLAEIVPKAMLELHNIKLELTVSQSLPSLTMTNSVTAESVNSQLGLFSFPP